MMYHFQVKKGLSIKERGISGYKLKRRTNISSGICVCGGYRPFLL